MTLPSPLEWKGKEFLKEVREQSVLVMEKTHTYLSYFKSLCNRLQTFLAGALHRQCELNKLPIEQLNPGDKTALA